MGEEKSGLTLRFMPRVEVSEIRTEILFTSSDNYSDVNLALLSLSPFLQPSLSPFLSVSLLCHSLILLPLLSGGDFCSKNQVSECKPTMQPLVSGRILWKTLLRGTLLGLTLLELSLPLAHWEFLTPPAP